MRKAARNEGLDAGQCGIQVLRLGSTCLREVGATTALAADLGRYRTNDVAGLESTE